MKQVCCPTCQAPAYLDPQKNSYRPFCSQRCQQIDLGAWADQSYRIASAEPLPEQLISELEDSKNPT
jgi:endogenous inhibitor of DNA gyrase (YacG/DUF329 family)